MSVFTQWLLMIVASITLITFAIKGKELNTKKILVVISIGMVIFFIDTYGTLGVDNVMNNTISILMWIAIIGLSAFFIIQNDTRRLAMVLYIPAVVILFRLIEIVASKIHI